MAEHSTLTPLDQASALSLVVAAATAVGGCPSTPDGQSAWLGRVQDISLGLFRLVPVVVDRSAQLAECITITGVIVNVEEVSGRAKITIRPTIGSDPEATEDLRTPWLSEREGRDMADLATTLLGRHCRFGKRIERQASNARRTVRMCEWIEDAGPAPDDQPPSGVVGGTRTTGEVATNTGRPAPRDGALDVVALRSLRPTNMSNLVEMAATHLGLDTDAVNQAVLAQVGPSATGTKTQLFKVWNHLITATIGSDQSGTAA